MTDSIWDTTFGDALATVKNYGPTAIIILMFIIGCSVGINIHSKCRAAQDSKLYNNLRETLNYGLTVGITSLATLSILRISKGVNAKYIGLLFTFIGVITSGMTLGMFYKCKDENYGDRKKALEGVAWISFILPLLAGVFLLTR